MKKLLLFSLVLIFSSCQNNYEILSINIDQQKHIIENHYDSEIKICLKDEIGSSSFRLTMYVETKDNRSFECNKTIYINAAIDIKPEDKCFNISTRPFFNKRTATKEDFLNMKSFAKGNIKSIQIMLLDDSSNEIITKKTFKNL